MKPAPERELEIGRRLRAFREAKRISRTAFALSIQIGSDRLASYEAGRVPLRFEVFKAVNQEYCINPVWLATGEGSLSEDRPLSLNEIDALAPPNMPFSQVYDSYLEALCKDRVRYAQALLQEYLEWLGKLDAFREHNPTQKFPPGVAKELSDDFYGIKSELVDLLKFQDVEEDRIKRVAARAVDAKEKLKAVLTVTSLKSRMAGVKIQTLDELRAVLRAKTSHPGDMARLAKTLGVQQARVSEWLSGKKEPGGKTTLRLLHWVEQQERQPNAPGSAMNTAKGKTQVR